MNIFTVFSWKATKVSLVALTAYKKTTNPFFLEAGTVVNIHIEKKILITAELLPLSVFEETSTDKHLFRQVSVHITGLHRTYSQ